MANTSKRGFASMDSAKQREIASKGGRAAHAKGTAHEFTSEEARVAGRKGGEAVSRDRAHMSAIGREGGHSRGRTRTDQGLDIQSGSGNDISRGIESQNERGYSGTDRGSDRGDFVSDRGAERSGYSGTDRNADRNSDRNSGSLNERDVERESSGGPYSGRGQI